MKILLHIAFLGTNYCGYQIQRDKPTVQAVLCEASERVFGEMCDITGCSRTDSGVHANEFCATVAFHRTGTVQTTIPIEKLPLVYSKVLPRDISVFYAEYVSDEFHARYDVKFKEYEYRIYDSQVPSPFFADRSLHYPMSLDDRQIAEMDRAAKAFVGKHDFAAYMAQGSDITDTTRTVFDALCVREGDFVVFRVSADGFLYNMVRIFTGTLLSVAQGRISADDIPAITSSKDRTRAGATAPAHGLYLNRVVYDLK